jgi:hypothetical protein
MTLTVTAAVNFSEWFATCAVHLASMRCCWPKYCEGHHDPYLGAKNWRKCSIVRPHLPLLTAQYDQVITKVASPAPGYALGVLAVLTAVMGALDGCAIGAVYGEAGERLCASP